MFLLLHTSEATSQVLRVNSSSLECVNAWTVPHMDYYFNNMFDVDEANNCFLIVTRVVSSTHYTYSLMTMNNSSDIIASVTLTAKPISFQPATGNYLYGPNDEGFLFELSGKDLSILRHVTLTSQDANSNMAAIDQDGTVITATYGSQPIIHYTNGTRSLLPFSWNPSWLPWRPGVTQWYVNGYHSWMLNNFLLLMAVEEFETSDDFSIVRLRLFNASVPSFPSSLSSQFLPSSSSSASQSALSSSPQPSSSNGASSSPPVPSTSSPSPEISSSHIEFSSTGVSSSSYGSSSSNGRSSSGAASALSSMLPVTSSSYSSGSVSSARSSSSSIVSSSTSSYSGDSHVSSSTQFSSSSSHAVLSSSSTGSFFHSSTGKEDTDVVSDSSLSSGALSGIIIATIAVVMFLVSLAVLRYRSLQASKHSTLDPDRLLSDEDINHSDNEMVAIGKFA